MTAILGISAFYHDSAAALVVDGKIVAAAQEERFTRKKHDEGFPRHAVEYCLNKAGLSPAQIDYVGFYDKPLVKFERLLETYLAFAPVGLSSFFKAMPQWVKDKLWMNRMLRKEMGSIAEELGMEGGYTRRFVYTEHHESHAASAFFPSPFDEAAILTIDGVGEWATTTYGVGRGNRIELTHQVSFPHSLGLLYSAFTYFCGFKVNSGEYKLMGLAPYGEPKYRQLILDNLIDLKEDGSFRLNMEYFTYCQTLRMTGSKFAALFGGPPRAPESEMTQREMDMAASVQVVTEEVMLRQARHVRETTGMKNLCLAGGCALNCVANGKILSGEIFDEIWIQPAAGDAGGALGTALFVWHQLLENDRAVGASDSQTGSFLGPDTAPDPTLEFLETSEAVFEKFDDEAALQERLAGLLAEEKVIGLCRGPMEFGPRALGHRSIIGDARSPQMQSTMNLKIKFRESFRPFAPCVLQEEVHEYFQMKPGQESPYMLLVADVAESKRVEPKSVNENGAGGGSHAEGLAKLHQIRSTVPAITHVDMSARVQTVDKTRHEFLHGVMSKFKEKTGCPVIINTSFNVRGEPIVCDAADAYRCFMATNMDVLVVGDYLLLKDQQPNAQTFDSDKHLAQFALD